MGAERTRSREAQEQAEPSPATCSPVCQSPTGSVFDPACCPSPMDRFFEGTPTGFYGAPNSGNSTLPIIAGMPSGQAGSQGVPVPTMGVAGFAPFAQQGFGGWPSAMMAPGPVFFCPQAAVAPMSMAMPMAMAPVQTFG